MYDQQSITFCAATEALLSPSGGGEVTHQVAERAAWLLGSTPQARVDVYDQMKAHYDRRSFFVHGNPGKRKGTEAPSAMGAKADEMATSDLFEVVKDLLRVALRHKPYRQVLEDTSGKAGERMSAYFKRVIFGVEKPPKAS
jgi:hypothetical protein